MNKKFFLTFVILFTVITANAQFESGKAYINTSLSNLNVNFKGKDKLNIGVGAQAGYFIEDDWLISARVGYNHIGGQNAPDNISVGAGIRYYIEQNGLFLGLNCNLIHADHNYNDVMPGIELGYAFFLSRTVTIEPSIYYDQSFKKHSDFSTVGLRIGFGIYLE